MINWRIGKQTADVRMRAPQVMTNHLTASEVIDLKAEMTTALVCFEQSRVCVCAKILPHMDTRSFNVKPMTDER